MSDLKREILLRKAKKFFEQFPDKTSAILKMTVGRINTHWNIQKESNRYNITEINSSKQSIIIREDERTISGKAQKPFMYDPEQKPGTGTVAPGKELSTYQRQAPKGSPASIGMAAHQIRTGPLGKTFQSGQQPPALPTKQQQISKKIDKVSQGKNHFDRETMKKAASTLSDQEFGQYYGFSKQSALKQASTPPPLPSKIKQAGMKQYGTKPILQKTKTLTTGKTFSKKVIKEASPSFSKISAAFMDYMAKQGDHVAQSNFINTISREKMKLLSQQEKDSVAAIESQYLGQATKATDASTKQSPLSGMAKTSPVGQTRPLAQTKPLTQGVQRIYRILLSEADGDIKGIDTEEPPEGQTGEVPDLPEQEPEEPKKTAEEQAISKLAGQTIRSAEVEFDESRGKLSLELANTHQPATLEWDKSGKIIFTFKGIRYTLKKQ